MARVAQQPCLRHWQVRWSPRPVHPRRSSDTARPPSWIGQPPTSARRLCRCRRLRCTSTSSLPLPAAWVGAAPQVSGVPHRLLHWQRHLRPCRRRHHRRCRRITRSTISSSNSSCSSIQAAAAAAGVVPLGRSWCRLPLFPWRLEPAASACTLFPRHQRVVLCCRRLL